MFNKGWQPKDYKGLKDEIHQQHIKTKDMSFKDKLGYFWYYYKIHTIAVILIIIFGVSLIHTIASSKDYCFYGIMLNAPVLEADAMEASFGEYAGLDMENYDCFIDTVSTYSLKSQTEFDIATLQRMIGLIQSKSLDVLVADAQTFENFSFNGMIADLRNIMSKEELAQYEGRIYYLDNVEVQRARAEEEMPDGAAVLEEEQRSPLSAEELAVQAEAHRHPENMEEPVPVGIFIEDSAVVSKTGCYDGMIPVYGISSTSKRTDAAIKYLAFLWDDTIPFEDMISPY